MRLEIKQIKANGKGSYDDFDLYINSRSPSLPSKRKNVKTVPGMHGSYDFSSLYGEVIFENRTVEYKFDVTGITVERLEEERRRILDWLLNINETEIYDTYIPNYHWYGSYEDSSWSEDAEQGTLTAKFLVYPFLISNLPIETNFTVTSEEKNILINNKSSHRVVPTITTDGEITINNGSSNVILSAGTWQSENLYLEKGENTFTVSGNANICISYNEEVF